MKEQTKTNKTITWPKNERKYRHSDDIPILILADKLCDYPEVRESALGVGDTHHSIHTLEKYSMEDAINSIRRKLLTN